MLLHSAFQEDPCKLHENAAWKLLLSIDVTAGIPVTAGMPVIAEKSLSLPCQRRKNQVHKQNTTISNVTPSGNVLRNTG